MEALQPIHQIDRSQNIDGWNVRIYFASRNPRVLLAVAVLVMAVAIGIAWFVQKPVLEAFGIELHGETLQTELKKEQPDMERVLEGLPRAARSLLGGVQAKDWIAASKLSQSEKAVATALWTNLSEDRGMEPGADLLYYAHYVKPLRYANQLIGDHYLARSNIDEAVKYYRREAKFPDARGAREKLLGILVEKRDHAGLRVLAADPSFSESFMPEHKLYFAALEHRWSDLIAPLCALQARMLAPVPAMAAAVAGLVWFLVAAQAIQPPRVFSFRTVALVLAVLAGMVSTFPTLLASIWMEEAFGMRSSSDPLGNIVFYMLGVGPREELLKLALFVPFLPILLKRKSPLEMIVVAGCVGLGFAVWENLQYFARYGSAVAFPRFLTANFFHFALTGLNGLALCNVLRSPVKKALPFVVTLLGTSFAHGAYDTLASFSSIPILQFGCMVVFMLVSLMFFRTLQGLRDGSTDQICIAGTLIAGLSLLAGLIVVFAAREIGLVQALGTLAITGFGMIMVVYMFYWQLGEGMSAEPAEPARPYAV
jgi:RsiW-degrading membrane proteinase PrsW (M82 family)